MTYGSTLGLPPPQYDPRITQMGDELASAFDPAPEVPVATATTPQPPADIASLDDSKAADEYSRQARQARQTGDVRLARQLEDWGRQASQRESQRWHDEQDQSLARSQQDAADWNARSSPEALNTAIDTAQTARQSKGVLANAPAYQVPNLGGGGMVDPATAPLPGTLPNDLRNHKDPQIRAFVRGESNSIGFDPATRQFMPSSLDNTGSSAAKPPEVLEAEQQASERDFRLGQQGEAIRGQVNTLDERGTQLRQQRALLPPTKDIEGYRQQIKRDRGLNSPDENTAKLEKIVAAADHLDEQIRGTEQSRDRTRSESANFDRNRQSYPGQTPEQAGRTKQKELNYRDQQRAESEDRYQRSQDRAEVGRDVEQAKQTANDLKKIISRKEKDLGKYDPTTRAGARYLEIKRKEAPDGVDDRAWAAQQMKKEGEQARKGSEFDDAQGHLDEANARIKLFTSNEGLDAIANLQQKNPHMSRSDIVNAIIRHQKKGRSAPKPQPKISGDYE